VLLPFPQNSADAKARRNQFVTDLYAGMLLARDSLAKNQVQLNLFTYDAPADTNKIKATLALPEMASMDLIIGPVYKNASNLITRYAQQYNVNSINPLSDDASLVKDNQHVYLFESSIKTQARQSAAYAIQNFPLKTAIILTESNRDDTAFANTYRREFERLGGKVKTYQKFNPRKTSIATLLSSLDLKTAGHLLILSNTPGVAIYTLSQLEQADSNIPVLTYPSWLQVNQLALNQFNNRNFYFIYPKFIDNTLPGPQQFRQKYSSLFHVPPSVYAYSGFEMMYYFGQALQKYGRNFTSGLQNEGPVSGVIFSGIGYTGAHDNQYVPLLKMENLQLIVANPIFR
jgi:ABC-type branched-subunit amino acid transport system substrate-binding protein